MQKKLRTEVIQLEDTLAQVRKEYEMLRIEFEQNLAANEQAGEPPLPPVLGAGHAAAHSQEMAFPSSSKAFDPWPQGERAPAAIPGAASCFPNFYLLFFLLPCRKVIPPCRVQEVGKAPVISYVESLLNYSSHLVRVLFFS